MSAMRAYILQYSAERGEAMQVQEQTAFELYTQPAVMTSAGRYASLLQGLPHDARHRREHLNLTPDYEPADGGKTSMSCGGRGDEDADR
jgi:hypothetical protein